MASTSGKPKPPMVGRGGVQQLEIKNHVTEGKNGLKPAFHT